MPEPTCPAWDHFIRPVLELATEGEITRRLAREQIPQRLQLSEEIMSQRINSGPRRVDNRIGWAMSHLVKAKLIEKIRRATYAITDAGKQFLAQHQDNPNVTYHDLKAIDGFEQAWQQASAARQAKQPCDPTGLTTTESTTPEEQIEQAHAELNADLSNDLLEALAAVNPYHFEQIVIDLLFAMGYGGSREEAAQVTQKSNDEGIDGIINEDRLGLDVIYVQAKRWQNTVGRKEIQSFVGALAGKQASKGVFITTSDFANTATQYAATVTQKVILIDGQRLAELLIEHDIGVSTTQTIRLKRIDTDYFEQ